MVRGLTKLHNSASVVTQEALIGGNSFPLFCGVHYLEKNIRGSSSSYLVLFLVNLCLGESMSSAKEPVSKDAYWIDKLRALALDVFSRVNVLLGKPTAFDLVKRGAAGDETLQIDATAENAIIEFCRRLPIPSTLISEEAGILEIQPTVQKSTSIPMKHVWVIADPVDGSKNAQQGIPFFNTSIAIAQRPRIEDLQAGVVLNLRTRDEYVVERGVGAYTNQKPAHPSATRSLKNSLVGTAFTKADFAIPSKTSRLLQRAHKIRGMGAVAEELCFVGSGSLDLFVYLHNKLRFIDIAAAKVFVEQAGGVITDHKGVPHQGEIFVNKKVKVIASANKSLLRSVLKILL